MSDMTNMTTWCSRVVSSNGGGMEQNGKAHHWRICQAAAYASFAHARKPKRSIWTWASTFLY